MSVGDFNNDGNLDLVGSNFINNSLLWVQGTGDFEFLPQVYGGSGNSTFAVTQFDANEDGTNDIVAVNIGSDDFTVHIGTGDDQFFNTPQFTRIPRSVTDVAVGDLDGDNLPEVITANPTAGSITILSDLQNGQYREREDLILSQPSAAAIADINDDGINDVVTTNRNTDSVSILFGQGAGVLATAVSFAVCDDPFRLAVADVNNDDALDVVAACFGSDNVSVLLNDGQDGFLAATNFAGAGEPQDIVIVDLNADNALDIVLADSTQNNSGVRVLFGQGNGGFDPATLVAVGSVVASVAIGDVNDDGTLDLAIGDLGQGIRIALGSGAGSFGNPFTVPGPTSPLSLEVDDINADGFADVIAIEAGGGQTSVASTITLSNGDGSFQDDIIYAVASGVDSPFAQAGVLRTLNLADVNADGRKDLLVGIASAEFPGALSVDLNRSSFDIELDSDGDGVSDSVDNCLLVSNADQRDTNGDGFGNICDPDLNNDNIVNFLDLSLLSDAFLTSDADADLDGSGAVNFLDLSIFSDFFLQAPGPSATN